MAEEQREYEKNPMGHKWERDEEGSLNIFAYSVGTHNGPRCVRCNYHFCHHCRQLPERECTKAKTSVSVEEEE